MQEENKKENLFEGNSDKTQPKTFSVDDFDYLLGENGVQLKLKYNNGTEEG